MLSLKNDAKVLMETGKLSDKIKVTENEFVSDVYS